MVTQPRHHRWRPLPPPALLVLLPQGPHTPTEVVTVHGETGHRLVDVPVLAEAIGPPSLAGVAVTVRAVVPLHVRRAYLRPLRQLTEDHLCAHSDHAPLALLLDHPAAGSRRGPAGRPGWPVRGGVTPWPKVPSTAPG